MVTNSDITIIEGDDPSYPYKLVNTDDSEIIEANQFPSDGRCGGRSPRKVFFLSPAKRMNAICGHQTVIGERWTFGIV